MYVIKKITVIGENYQSSKIINHTNKKISFALSLLENCARDFAREEFGIKAFEQAKILDIHKIDQICEPIVDCMLLYRLNDDPHRIHVYQRRTEVVNQNGWFSTSKIPQSQFKKTHIFELEEYVGLIVNDNTNPNIFPFFPHARIVPIGPANIKVPESMTNPPFNKLLTELKNSIKFKARFEASNSSVNVKTDLT
jgi:hypothetical protein